ncbi:MAG: hypothetical protein R3F11_11325 [Verrucomicrobiales bacterium]
MTLDRAGRPVVSGKSYIKALHDRDGVGSADDAVVFAQPAAGAWTCSIRAMTCSSAGTADSGAIAMRMATARGWGAGLIDKFGSGEHGIHAIRRELDNAIYVIGGNDSKHLRRARARRKLAGQGAGGRGDPPLHARPAIERDHRPRVPQSL